MQGILPGTAKLRDWGYTLLGLFIVTIILVLNLPRITGFGGVVIRAWQEGLFDISKKFVIGKLSKKRDGREDGIELEEMNEGESSDTGEV
jgi:hypothetical protein